MLNSNDDHENIHTNNEQPFLLRYLPILILLFLFWPILLTLIAASVSASAWLFWLCIGAAFSILQLLYVLWNFGMIVWDVGALTMLKTFAIIRSFVRHYTYTLGIRNILSTTTGGGGGGERELRRRKRRDWRTEVDRASTFDEFSMIELLEPEGKSSIVDVNSSDRNKVDVMSSKTKSNDRIKRRTVDTLSSSQFGLRNRKSSNNCHTTADDSNNSSTRRRMRKIQSSRELNESSSREESPCSPPRRRKPPSSHSTSLSNPRLLRRAVSSALLPLDSSTSDEEEGDEDDNDYSNDNFDSRNEEIPANWQRAVQNDLGVMTGSMLVTTLTRLKDARLQAMSLHNAGCSQNTTHGSNSSSNNNNEDYCSSIKTLLSGIVKRNHLSVDDFLMEDARLIAERGQHALSRKTRDTIDMYGNEVERCIEWVASGPVYLGDTASSSSTTKSRQSTDNIMQKQHDELSRRYVLFKRMKQNMGHTALMLSGGGAQAMYHLGTIKALVESSLYEHIHVISGTSGGSIVAAMCAIKTPTELLRDVCVNTVSTDYMLNGEMKRQGVSWFPSIYKMGETWMKSGVLMDSKEFFRCCEFYYSNITFEEAYEMTGKSVCITVSASRAYAGSGVQRLLLNHISTPHVTLSSAVSASCSLPGAMKPTKLMMKNSNGEQVPFEVDGVEWIDGSVQADLPFKRISTLFNISNFVVCQTNFHVVPFLNKSHHPNVTTLYWKLFEMCMWDVQSRVIKLSQLGLFPKIFGQDLTKLVTQKYFGKLTLVPRFTTLQMIGLKILSNPTVVDMDNYLQNGQVAAWPFLRVLSEMLRIERSIDAGLAKLDQRLTLTVTLGLDSKTLPNDDVDSLSSVNYRGRLPGLGREAELLKVENRSLRNENKKLRQQVECLQRSLGISHDTVVGSATTSLEGRLISIDLQGNH